MFERFVTRSKHLQLHRQGPMRDERERYLQHLADEGRSMETFKHAAGYILHAAVLLDLNSSGIVSEERLRLLGQEWCDGNFRGGVGRRKPSAPTIRMFLGRIRHWLTFCGRMELPQIGCLPFDNVLQGFLDFKRADHGWSSCTVDIYRRDVGLFLAWAAEHAGGNLQKLDARTLTTYVQEPQFTRWSRCSIVSHICHVRVFLRWLGERDGCDPVLWDCIHAPRLYRLERYPQGPTWTQVRELLDSTDTQNPNDIRDRATLGDIEYRPDGTGSVRLIGKGSKTRSCPLWSTTVEKLKELAGERKQSEKLFINQRHRPLTRFGVHTLVARHVATAVKKIASMAKKRIGPHTIRHTTATHLLRAGVDINTIRAWLGHVSINTTNIYAEVDLETKAKMLASCELSGPQPTKRRPWKADPKLMEFLRAL
jgi:site-specific recombinase XerD